MQDRFNELLYYSESSTTGLRWKLSRGSAKKDSDAGCLKTDGYYRLKVDGKDYQVHRAIWIMKFGSIPEGCVIDHIDRNPLNNVISNLRAVSIQKNNLNRSNVHSKNSYLQKKNSRWSVTIPLGTFSSEQEALQARDLALHKLGISI